VLIEDARRKVAINFGNAEFMISQVEMLHESLHDDAGLGCVRVMQVRTAKPFTRGALCNCVDEAGVPRLAL